MLGLKNILRTSTLALLLSSVLLFAQNSTEFILEDILNQVKENSAFEEISEDEREDFLADLNLAVSGYDKEGVKDVLEGYDFSEDFVNSILEKVPTKLAGTPKISIEELDNLANMDFREVINIYVKTGKIPKGFESFEDDLKEIKAIIKDKEAIIRKGQEADKKIQEEEKIGEEAEKRGEEADKLRKKIEKLIEKMKEMKKNSYSFHSSRDCEMPIRVTTHHNLSTSNNPSISS